MKHIIKFSKLFESNDTNQYREEVDQIVNIFLDIIDDFDGEVTFGSNLGSMTLKDYNDRNERYDNFEPVYDTTNNIKSYFTIIFIRINNYSEITKLITEMESCIGRLSDLGWTLSDMNIDKRTNLRGFRLLKYEFTRPDVEIKSKKKLTEEQIKKAFELTQIIPYDIFIEDEYIYVGFGTSVYDDSGFQIIPHDIDEQIQKVVDILGFSNFKREDFEVRIYY